MAAKPLRTIRKRASAERCLRSLGATSAMVTPDRKTAHRFVRGGLWHRCLRKDQLESPEFTGFYLPPGIAVLLVFWMQTGQSGRLCFKRPAQDKLRDRSHPDTERQQVREAHNLLVAFDKQRRDMDPALEAVEDAFHTVCIAIAQHRLLQRQPLLPRLGDKGLPAQTLAKIGNGVFLASDVRDVVARFLDHPLWAARRASAPAYVLGGLLDLLFPGHAE